MNNSKSLTNSTTGWGVHLRVELFNNDFNVVELFNDNFNIVEIFNILVLPGVLERNQWQGWVLLSTPIKRGSRYQTDLSYRVDQAEKGLLQCLFSYRPPYRYLTNLSYLGSERRTADTRSCTTQCRTLILIAQLGPCCRSDQPETYRYGPYPV